ncbi:DUF3179 domain-containing (seleno)protein [Kribbella catacumbae]|uniref:DUF3179 domain-containing (seleno)protein n=1 Tax=Kribbella catacumbae TaxID=460086 RepID=UPI0003626F57|nr:DUF3179 domain-containing (seleno)protein [Kribbella catacumbae]
MTNPAVIATANPNARPIATPRPVPAIDNPRFQRTRDVDWLAETEPVLALTVNGESRAYPIQILTWHEIVNDTVAGIPVAVTYCPLCNSGVAFDRRVGSRTLTFGTSGSCTRATGRDIGTVAVFEPVAGGRPLTFTAAGAGFVDAQTGSRWNILGRATGGSLAGSQLSAYPFIDTFWFTWIAFQPSTQLIR